MSDDDATTEIIIKPHNYEPISEWRQQPNGTDEMRTIACATCGDTAIEIRPGTGTAQTAEDGMKPGTGA